MDSWIIKNHNTWFRNRLELKNNLILAYIFICEISCVEKEHGFQTRNIYNSVKDFLFSGGFVEDIMVKIRKIIISKKLFFYRKYNQVYKILLFLNKIYPNIDQLKLNLSLLNSFNIYSDISIDINIIFNIKEYIDKLNMPVKKYLNYNENGELECCICLEKIDMLYIMLKTCGHSNLCYPCSKKIRKCPLCNSDIFKKVICTDI